MSNNNKKRTLITAALPYANGPIHIGHLAGAYLPSDIYNRYLKAKGEEVLFICGSDEHGAAITLRAKKEGKSPQEIVDQYHTLNEQAFKDFGIEFDIFHRTSDQIHHETAQSFFNELNNEDVFTKKTTEQFYDEEFKQFLADRYISGTCPKCDFDSAYGDQCENCGSSLSPTDLIHPISTLSGKTPTLKETSHWYLPMNEDEAWLKAWIEDGTLEGKKHHDPKRWRKHVVGQCKSWLDGGLQERAMTRDLDWGVKVPLKEADGKVLYVWLDAPIGYISATKAWAEQNGKNWKDYWQSEETEMIHFIGKDNIVFHCIIFPIILKRQGNYNLPINVAANEFLNLEGKKISTSRNWAVWLHEYNKRFPEQQDELRYTLTSIAPETKDSEFTWSDFQTRNNSELVSILGNFIHRAIVLTHKYYDGKTPHANTNDQKFISVQQQMVSIVEKLNSCMDQLQFRDAQTEAMALARLGNKFLADSEPWKLIKSDPESVQAIMNISLQIAANIAVAFGPFLPNFSERLSAMLHLENRNWNDLGSMSLIKNGQEINLPEHLFKKIEDPVIEDEINRLKTPASATDMDDINAFKPHISFEDFLKLDIRIGTIVSVKNVPKSNKLLELEIDLGNEKRTILSGIAKHFATNELIGEQVQVLCNLPPRKMMGIESNGMVLMAEDSDGKLSLLQPNNNISPGSIIS